MRAGSKYKFLRIHTGRHDLPYFQSPLVNMQLSFFDAFVKGDDYDGWKTGKEPPVRFAVRRGTPPLHLFDETNAFKWRAESEWPPKRAQNQTLYLQPDKTLGASQPSQKGVLSYDGLT
jgi:predicted acyl esterase